MEKQQIDADQYHQRSHRMVSRINCKLETIIANPLKQSDIIFDVVVTTTCFVVVVICIVVVVTNVA